jgi:hypothetical protein
MNKQKQLRLSSRNHNFCIFFVIIKNELTLYTCIYIFRNHKICFLWDRKIYKNIPVLTGKIPLPLISGRKRTYSNTFFFKYLSLIPNPYLISYLSNAHGSGLSKPTFCKGWPNILTCMHTDRKMWYFTTLSCTDREMWYFTTLSCTDRKMWYFTTLTCTDRKMW